MIKRKVRYDELKQELCYTILPDCIIHYIINFVIDPPIYVKDEFLLKNFDWKWFSGQLKSVHIIEEQIHGEFSDRLNWTMICGNPNAVHIIEEAMSNELRQKLDWNILSRSHINSVKLNEIDYIKTVNIFEYRNNYYK